MIKLAPLRDGFAGWDQWNHRAESLLLLRAREGIPTAVEDSVHRVVVMHRDWIKLMIMTPRATQAEPHHRLSQRIDGVLNCEMVVVLGIEPEAT
jgi:hypothetical protein